MQQYFEQKLDLSETLYQITSRFAACTLHHDLLIFFPLALLFVEIFSCHQSGPQFTLVLRGTYAIKVRRFSTALSVLKDEFLRSRDYPQCPPTSHLFQLPPISPVRICMYQVTIRSTGWTRGIFSNFAAESMVPKGPEWGGGNWEINTPTNLKDIPQRELAAEVTHTTVGVGSRGDAIHNIRTDDGSIPSIVTGRIGVYIGLIKGRVMGLETLTQSSGSPYVVDEKAKSGEEFKKLLYGTAGDGGSNDEDNGSLSQAAPHPTMSLGLSDGGVPPQSAGQPSGMQQAQQACSPTLSEITVWGRFLVGSCFIFFKTGLVHIEQNQLSDALSCFDEGLLALAKDQSRGADIKAPATICAQYKAAVTILQEIGWLQKVQGPSASAPRMKWQD
ncbi:hypothetical protein AgCh_012521 [Apium graveolens]